MFERAPGRALSLICAGVLLICLAVFWVGACGLGGLSSADDWQRIAGSFNGLEALFAGCAFAGLILALYLQRKELQLQRDELQATREELKRSADAQSEANELAKRQTEVLAAQSAVLTRTAAAQEANVAFFLRQTPPRLTGQIVDRPSDRELAVRVKNIGGDAITARFAASGWAINCQTPDSLETELEFELKFIGREGLIAPVEFKLHYRKQSGQEEAGQRYAVFPDGSLRLKN